MTDTISPPAHPTVSALAAFQHFGPCCICEKDEGDVHTIAMLEFEAPAGFSGWGCALCQMPSIGAIAVLCEDCAQAQRTDVKFICGGEFAADRQRIALEGYEQKPFTHREEMHPELKQVAANNDGHAESAL